MLSQGQLDAYRAMSPSERLALSLRMTEENWRALTSGPAERVDRRFELLNRENDARNRNLLAAFARLRDANDSP
jgi:hypothetical protein